MEQVTKCTSALRLLLARGETNSIPLAEKALDDLVEATPRVRQKVALDDVRAVVQEHRRTAEGSQLGFADLVNDYIEKLMRGLE